MRKKSYCNSITNSTFTNKSCISTPSNPLKDYREYIGQLELIIETQNKSIKVIEQENVKLKERCEYLEKDNSAHQSSQQESLEMIEMLQSKVSAQ